MKSFFNKFLAAFSLVVLALPAFAQVVPESSLGGGGIVPGYNSFTASRVLVTNAQGKPVTSSVTTTQLNTLSNFNENVDDRVAALIQNGTGITWTYDDAGGTLTGNLNNTAVTAGSYTCMDATVDAQGRITTAANGSCGGGGGGSPGGSTTQIQYNLAGAFGADANFFRDPATNYQTYIKATDGNISDILSAAGTGTLQMISDNLADSKTSFVIVGETSGVKAKSQDTTGFSEIEVTPGQVATRSNNLVSVETKNTLIATAQDDAAEQIGQLQLNGNGDDVNFLKYFNTTNDDESIIQQGFLDGGAVVGTRIKANSSAGTSTMQVIPDAITIESTDGGDNTDRITLSGDGTNGLTIASQNASSATSFEVKPTESVLYGLRHTVTATDGGDNTDIVTLTGDGTSGVTIQSVNAANGNTLTVSPTIISLDSSVSSTILGDATHTHNNTFIESDDSTGIITLNAPTGELNIGTSTTYNTTDSVGLFAHDTGDDTRAKYMSFYAPNGSQTVGDSDGHYEADGGGAFINFDQEENSVQVKHFDGLGSNFIGARFDPSAISFGLNNGGTLAQFFRIESIGGGKYAILGDADDAYTGAKVTVDITAEQTTLATGVIYNGVAVDGAYAQAPKDYYIDVDTTSGAGQVVLLSAGAYPRGKTVVITDAFGTAATNDITITPDGSDTINGASSYIINQNNQSITLHSDGVSNWIIN